MTKKDRQWEKVRRILGPSNTSFRATRLMSRKRLQRFRSLFGEKFNRKRLKLLREMYPKLC